jgi:hypothetical protein
MIEKSASHDAGDWFTIKKKIGRKFNSLSRSEGLHVDHRREKINVYR